MSLILLCCNKPEPKEKSEYFKFKIDGTATRLSISPYGISGGGGSSYCSIYGDTVLFVVAGIYESVVFYIKSSKISDGSYQLNNLNKAYYTKLNGTGELIYKTTSLQTGTLTIKRSIFPLPAGAMNTLDGIFSFTAIDSVTNKIITITDGKFMLQRDEE
jgi:hypothetical protein